MLRKLGLVALLAAAGCALYSEVTVTPLNLLPSNIERGADLPSMLETADFLRAMEMAPVIDARPRKSATDLAALGAAYLAAGRYDDARMRLRAAPEREPCRTPCARVAGEPSQVEYLPDPDEDGS